LEFGFGACGGSGAGGGVGSMGGGGVNSIRSSAPILSARNGPKLDWHEELRMVFPES